MNRYFIPGILLFTLAAALLLYRQSGSREEPKEYLTLLELPHGEAAVRMHRDFESGRVFFQLDDRFFSWHPVHFDPGYLGGAALHVPKPQRLIALTDEHFDQFAKVRARTRDTFESWEGIASLDDTLFPWNHFFYEDEDEDE